VRLASGIEDGVEVGASHDKAACGRPIGHRIAQVGEVAQRPGRHPWVWHLLIYRDLGLHGDDGHTIGLQHSGRLVELLGCPVSHHPQVGVQRPGPFAKVPS